MPGKKGERQIWKWVTAHTKAMIENTKKIMRGELKTNDDKGKSYETLHEQFRDEIQAEILHIVKRGRRLHILGIISGALLSFLGGMFASSYFWWSKANPQTSLVIVLVCGGAFVLALIITFLNLREPK